MDSLRKKALGGAAFFLAAVLLLIVVPGGVTYWEGWLLWGNLSAWTLGVTLYFLKHDPRLVERRLHAGPSAEKIPAQKRIQLFMSIAIIAVFLVSALDHRFMWSKVPVEGLMIGHVLVALGYAVMVIVFRENTFAASVIDVTTDQSVVSTGPYACVRHPMYAGAAVTFVGIPLALASWWGLVPAAMLLVGLVARLLDEESHLVRALRGYDAYRSAVRHRLIPGIW